VVSSGIGAMHPPYRGALFGVRIQLLAAVCESVRWTSWPISVAQGRAMAPPHLRNSPSAAITIREATSALSHHPEQQVRARHLDVWQATRAECAHACLSIELPSLGREATETSRPAGQTLALSESDPEQES